MIARFSVLLPYHFSIPATARLQPHKFDYEGYSVTIHPPCEAEANLADTDPTSPTPLTKIIDQLRPTESQTASESFKVNGAPTMRANLLQIDFHKSEFDRRRTLAVHPDATEPPATLLFKLTNEFLITVRAVTRGGKIKPLQMESTPWRVDYLDDSGKELPAQSDLFRTRMMTGFSWSYIIVEDITWQQVQQLTPTHSPQTWHTLLLDAEALLPEIGPTLVLAEAALETLIAASLNHLAAASSLPPSLWNWINDRGDYRKEPSVEEQFDVLLRTLSGKSLKDESQLWEAFKHLKAARNSFLHEGAPVIGGKEVTPETAIQLLSKAKQIVDWMEKLLPLEMRRPGIDKRFNVEITKPVA